MGEEMVSPASGRVLRIIGEEGEGRTVSIFMHLHNLHVTVAPLDGVVKRITPEMGTYKPAFMRISDFNTKNTIVLDTKYGTIKVVQIAGFFTRRIKCDVEEGQAISKGERMGKICFGSRVDVSVPEGFELCVGSGTRVRCGKTVIAVL
ncbi:MAG: phosphatidylserine decarboxylase [Methanophagales archaeon]|nr:phosphatidylserine decarboxylase [Methanophagales archaeon]